MKTSPENQEIRDSLQEYAEAVLKDRHLFRKIKVHVEMTHTRRGHHYARGGIHILSVTNWAKKYGPNYVLSYLLHELAHAMCPNEHHDRHFKRVEMSLLKKYLHVRKVERYRRTYIDKAWDENGVVIFDKTQSSINVL